MAKTRKKTLKKVGKSPDVPVTQKQFTAFRSEIRHILTNQQLEIKAMEKRMDGRFEAMDAKFEAKFQEMDAKFEAKFQAMDAKMDSKFLLVDAQFLSLEAKIEKLTALVHRTNVIVEEQNARNIYVLDGLRSVMDVQEDLSERMKKVEKVTFGIES